LSDESLAKSALALISRRGRTVTLRQVDVGTYDPQLNDFTKNDQTDTTVKAVVTDYLQREVDGDLILLGDKRVLIAASGLTDAPMVGDYIIEGSGSQYRVMSVITVQPGEVAMLYKLQVRK
jgi:hypothetical protein